MHLLNSANLLTMGSAEKHRLLTQICNAKEHLSLGRYTAHDSVLRII